MPDNAEGSAVQSSNDARTAVLVIHGIGQQLPFETLDQFARGLFRELGGQGNANSYAMQHRQASVRVRDGDDWINNYISVEKPGRRSVDLYEYYWAHHMTGVVNVTQIVDWFMEVSSAARDLYREKTGQDAQDFRARQDRDPVLGALFEPNGRFHHNGYLLAITYGVTGANWALKVLGPMVRLNNTLVRTLASTAFWFVKKVLVDYVGDVVVYTTTDRKAEHFDVRQGILNGARAQIDSILNDPRYDRVIVVGHSLGSVIAYDLLNRLDNVAAEKPDYRRICGLITFGSPLDKIAFFFRQEPVGRMGEDGHFVRRQMLDHLYGYRRSDTFAVEAPVHVGFDGKDRVGHVYWMNFYNRRDPVSGHLDFYRVNKNKEVRGGTSWGQAHLAYWENEQMYRKIVEDFRNELVELAPPVPLGQAAAAIVAGARPAPTEPAERSPAAAEQRR